MPPIKLNTPAQHNINDLDSAEIEQIQNLIAERQHSRQQLSQLINLEISALAETMDKFLPGFWSRFLENRHRACKEFMQQKQNNQLKVGLIADESEERVNEYR
ncbi:MAG TPA: hypothetical protein V6D15_19730 [Oculatellaceae cyanobacterium]|jgi:hypothetical protein